MESKKILWFDIETASEVYTDEERFAYHKRHIWEQKMLDKQQPTTKKHYLENCGIYPEFSKVVCISMMFGDKVQSLTGEENKILTDFNMVLEKSADYVLGGFNIFGFDIPYLRKRMVINGIVPHKKLCIQNEKPRECSVVDVMNMWKHTSFSCSLDLLCTTLFGESPKSDMSGSNVSHAFYSGNIDMIKKYCEGDVQFTSRCYEAIINPQSHDQNIVNICSTEHDSTQEGIVNDTNKTVFTPADLLKQKSRGGEIVDKFEMAELYVDDLEHHYIISDELKSQLYDLRTREDEKHLSSAEKGDDGFPF